jgi:hypothetical protein
LIDEKLNLLIHHRPFGAGDGEVLFVTDRDARSLRGDVNQPPGNGAPRWTC